jgi:UDP-N-acetylglucosamine--N-acetylmuramyl-(pentapeptide) pyrophosphoryl-undecaprenol N-acetylglucosamine transferase
VAEEIRRRHRKAEILFVTGKRKIESDILRSYGFRQTSISIEGLKGRGWMKSALTILKIPLSLFQSLKLLRDFSAHLVLGVGGYSAGPVCLAARIMGLPTAIHEQNSFPGLTNRWLCRIVDRVFISFKESEAYFPGGAPLLTGNPVRREMMTEVAEGRKRGDEFTVLVVGGSQGARPINRTFMDSLAILMKKGRSTEVIHQTGEKDYQQVTEEYRDRNLKGTVRAFIRDMAGAYHRADLVVGRAGATTISELACLGKPSILIPYPFATNDHQVMNASALVRLGGAEMILQDDLSGEILAERILNFMEDRVALEAMGRRARAAGTPRAAGVITDQLLEMVEQRD